MQSERQTVCDLGIITSHHNQCGDLKFEKFFDYIRIVAGNRPFFINVDKIPQLKKIIQEFEDNYS